MGDSHSGWQVCEVVTESQADDLMRVFDLAHSGDTDGVFGALPPSYMRCLRRAIGRPHTTHFVGYLDDEAVCIASAARDGDLVGLYNVATIPEYRRRGLARRITARVMEWALGLRGAGNTAVFLQTVADSDVERLYESFGFERVYLQHSFA